jgi:hypothetical protein
MLGEMVSEVYAATAPARDVTQGYYWDAQRQWRESRLPLTLTLDRPPKTSGLNSVLGGVSVDMAQSGKRCCCARYGRLDVECR